MNDILDSRRDTFIQSSEKLVVYVPSLLFALGAQVLSIL